MAAKNGIPGWKLITEWKPKKEDILATNDGKIFLMLFEKAIPTEGGKVRIYDQFYIKKGSYEKQLEVICKYINYFLRYYDTDRELVLAYLKIKFAMDKEKRFNADNYNQLIDLIYEVLFSDSIIEKICKMVDDNYTDDIESSDNRKSGGKEKKHLESLEFTNAQIKVLLRISFGMKCISPILFHFAAINVIKIDKDSDMIYNFYQKLFKVLSPPDINIYNKLFVYVKAKVLESKSHNAPIFEQRDIMGSDEYSVISQFLRKVLISENIVKYRFGENIVGFNKTVIKYQLMFFLKEQYNKNLIEVTAAKNVDGLSGMDKLEMNLQKIDEGSVLLAEIGIKTTLERIYRDNDFDITDDEVEYYKKNLVLSPLQVNLIWNYWASEFGSFRDTSQIGRMDYIKLLLILKYRLMMSFGVSNKDGFNDAIVLPYLITGNIQDKISTRLIRNSKFTGKVEESALYKKLNEKKYSALSQIRPDYIMSLLSTFNNTVFTYCVYENQDLFGQVIEYNEDKVSDEMLFLIDQI